MMDPNPDAYTHKARFAAFEGATQLRKGSTHMCSDAIHLREGARLREHPVWSPRFPTTHARPHVGPTGLAPVEPQIPHYPRLPPT